MNIRDETRDDLVAVRQVLEAAFGQPAEADLVEALRQSGDAVISLVAEADGQVVGQVLFSTLQAPGRCIALAPVSVLPGRQNQGIGSALVRHGLTRARSDGWQAVFLLGDPQFYGRFGFGAAIADKFETPYPKAYVQALELTPGALQRRSGALVYAPAFLALG